MAVARRTEVLVHNTLTDAYGNRLKLELDLRTTNGQQTVVWGEHPATGKLYDYPLGSTPFDTKATNLPVLTQEDADRFFERTLAAAQDAGYAPKRPLERPAGAPAAVKCSADDRLTVLKALGEGENNLESRDDWVRLCLALITCFDQGDDDMREAWINWSGRYQGEVKDDEAERVWDSVTEVSGDLGMGTVVALLRQAGCDVGGRPPQADLTLVEDGGYDP